MHTNKHTIPRRVYIDHSRCRRRVRLPDSQCSSVLSGPIYIIEVNHDRYTSIINIVGVKVADIALA